MQDKMNIQWYPGHMTKTRRQMEQDLKQVDAVCEIMDARIPISSRNPDIDSICGNKPRMVILNRLDLADPDATVRWATYFKNRGIAAVATDCKSRRGINQFTPAVRQLLHEKIERDAAKGMTQGRVGAGTGATVGKLITSAVPQDSGIGSASITLPEGVTVGAVVAVNAVGDVYHPETGKVIGCAHMPDGTPVYAEGLLYGHAPVPQQVRIPAPGSNTTIGVVAVDCKLTKEQANRLADVSHDGLARTIRPVHTQMDGDTMFALATGRTDAQVNFVKLCAAAAEVTARAIANALLFSQP